jgi:phage shock protein A
MGILDRMSTILRANINDLLDRAEDPEKMLDQIIRDMDDAIRDARSQVADMIAQEKMVKNDLDEAQRMADEWAAKAELAVKKDRDDLALEALRRKKDYQEHATVYQQQWETQRATVEKLKQELAQLEAKRDDAVRNKQALIARHKAAVAQKKIATMGAKISTVDYSAELDRMERRIQEEEARAAAEAELAQKPSVEREFAALEADSGLQDELAALKTKVKGG